MKKFIIGVVAGVLAVEFLLSYLKFPISNMAIFGVCLAVSAVIGAFVYVIHLLSRDRIHEREVGYQRELVAAQERAFTIQALTRTQMQLLDKLYEQGAELKMLKSGGYALVNGDKYLPVDENQARYFLEGPQQ